MKNSKKIIIGIAAIIIAACSYLYFLNESNDSLEITHIPVQLKAKGNYSMLNIETGEIEFEGEFKNEVGIVSEGIFISVNSDKEIFYNKIIGKNQFKEIAGPFKEGSTFHSGVAFVTPEDDYVQAIDNEGEVLFKLSPKDGQEFVSVGQIYGNRALFKNQNDLYGFIDAKGNIAVEPKFDWVEDFQNGIARVCIHNDNGKSTVALIDVDGDIIQELDNALVGRPSLGQLPYSDEKDEWGVLDAKSGKKIVEAKEKFEKILVHEGNYFFENDDEWGLLDVKGEVLIRSKYEAIYTLKDGLYIGVSKDGKSYELDVINDKGEVIKNIDISGDDVFCLGNGNFIYRDGKEYVLSNEKGEILSKETIKKINFSSDLSSLVNRESQNVSSDFFDWASIEEIVKNIKSGQIGGIRIGQNCVDFEEKSVQFTKNGVSNEEQIVGIGIGGIGAYDWRRNGYLYQFVMGNGYSNSDDGDEDVIDADEGEEYGLEPEIAMAEGEGVAEGEDTPIKDDAPMYSTYQNSIYVVKQMNSGVISIQVYFDDYIKKPVTKTVTVETEYYSYDQEKTVGYEKNINALIRSITVGYSFPKNREKKLKEMFDEKIRSEYMELSKDKFKDKLGNTWSITSNGFEISSQ